jgi:apolipoprotein N-acyltransferase
MTGSRPGVPPAGGERERITRSKALLALFSGILLGFSFPPSPAGILACVGLVPLLLALEGIASTWRGLRITYLAMVVFHAITLNWTGGFSHMKDVYMMIAGSITILVHPFFYFLPMGAYLLVRKYLGRGVALAAFPLLWVGYEYSHTLTEWSFPWLSLGNSQTYSIPTIQMASVTGVLGLSFWVVVLNAILFHVVALVPGRTSPEGKKALRRWSIAFIIVGVLPPLAGLAVLADAASRREGDAKAVTVGMIQSNGDPWEKWSLDDWGSIEPFMKMTDSLLARRHGRRPDLVLWPETAIPFYMLTPVNAGVHARFRRWLDSANVPVLTGLPQAVFYPDSAHAPTWARVSRNGVLRYETFNAEAFMIPHADSVRWYGKMKMVPLAERVPYAETFSSFDFLRWGVGIGGWSIGRDTVVFTEPKTGVRFASFICYESVYPEFVADFVRRGAQFIAIITIDSWWGKMSGAYQHKQYAVLRAVENRRWVARCALGGISCYIDPYGQTYDATPLLTRATLVRTFPLTDERTFYTVHGDWLGAIALFASGLLVAAAAGQAFTLRRRRFS